MDLLPEIVDGKIVLNKDDKKVIRRAPVMTERKRMLKESFARLRAEKYKKKQIEEVDNSMAELNNMGHNIVTEDFEDSPFADRIDSEESILKKETE